MRLHPLAVLACLPLVASLPPAQTFAFRAEKGARVEKTFESALELDLDSMKFQVGGEEIPAGEMGELELHIESSSKAVFLDEYREGADGRPTVLARKYVELVNDEKQSTSADGEASEETTEEESDLEGQTVVFTWSEEDGDFKRAYEGDGADEALLEPLIEDCDLREFLPGKDVAEGDTWDLEAKAFDFLTSPGGDLGLEDPDKEDEEDDGTDEQLSDNLEGTLKATFKGTREEGGVKVGVIALEGELRTHAETTEEGEQGHSSKSRFEMEFDVEGEILWDLAAGRAHSFTLQGDARVDVDESNRVEFEGQAFEMSQLLHLIGKVSASGSWTKSE